MMQEVPCDDTNGESTFEFVEGKIEGLTLSDDGTGVFTTTADTPTPNTTSIPTVPPADHSQSFITPPGGDSSVPSTLAPVAAPAALPTFFTNLQATSTETTSSFPNPLSSTIPPIPAPLPIQSNIPSDFTVPTQPPQYSYSPAVRNPYSLSSKPPSHGYAYPTPPSNRIRPPNPMEAGQPMIQSMVPQQVPQSTGIPVAPVVQAQPIPFYNAPQEGAASVAVPFGDYDYGNQQQLSAHYSDTSDPKGLFGWIKESMPGGDFFSKVAEKAKSSMDSMITTLDPQMKQYIYSGGDVDLVVTSPEDDFKVTGVREAFQVIFGRASVRGIDSPGTLAPQLVGFSAALKAAEERINHLRRGNLIHEQQSVVAVEDFLAEFMPDRWYNLSCIVLQDPARQIFLTGYSQPIPVPSDAIQKLQEQTPADYSLRWSGLAMNISTVLAYKFQVPQTEWYEATSGLLYRDTIVSSAKTLAMQYKRCLYSGGNIS